MNLNILTSPVFQKIAIIEKSPKRRDFLRSLVSSCGYLPFCFDRETICFDNFQPLDPHMVLAGSLSHRRALRLINTLKSIKYSIPILIITENNDDQEAIGHYTFKDVVFLKAFSEPRPIRNELIRLAENEKSRPSYEKGPVIVGNSKAMVRIRQLVPVYAKCVEPVLLIGEPGVGKELVARAIHHCSSLRPLPFVKIGNKGIPYGQETGFLPHPGPGFFFDKKGERYINADSLGAIYIENIGTMQSVFQERLIDVIDSVANARCDGQSNFLLIASVHDGFEAHIESGRFLKKLYYRINILNFKMPPLRHRREDIPALIDFFVDKFCIESGKNRFDLSEKLKNMHHNYQWPGNVMELKRFIKYCLRGRLNALHQEADKDTKEIQQLKKICDYAEDVCNHLKSTNHISDSENLGNFSIKEIREKIVAKTEEKIVHKALEITHWNRKKAADLLNISYKSILNKIKKHKLI